MRLLWNGLPGAGGSVSKELRPRRRGVWKRNMFRCLPTDPRWISSRSRRACVQLLLATGVTCSASAAAAEILISPQYPKSSDRLVSGPDAIQVRVDTTYDLASVEATVGDVTVELTYSSTTKTWGGPFPFDQLASGEWTFAIAAVDVFGELSEAAVEVVVDRPPEIIVREPSSLVAYSSTLPLDIGCTDVEGECEITVYFDDEVIYEGGPEFQEELVLDSAFGEHTVRVKVDDQVRELYHYGGAAHAVPKPTIQWLAGRSAPPLELVTHVAGRIVDLDDQRVLWLAEDQLVLRTLGSSADVRLGTKERLGAAHLTADGAIWEDAERREILLLTPDSSEPMVVAGPAGELRYGDGTAAFCELDQNGSITECHVWDQVTNARVSLEQGVPLAVSDAGDVLYVDRADRHLRAARLDDQGTLQATLELGESYGSVWGIDDGVQFDGTRVGVSYIGDVSASQDAVRFYDGASWQQVFSGERPWQLSGRPTTLVNSGWAAYSYAVGSDHLEVRRLSPTSDATEMCVWSETCTMAALAPNGTMLLNFQGGTYLVEPEVVPGWLAPDRGAWRTHGSDFFYLHDFAGEQVLERAVAERALQAAPAPAVLDRPEPGSRDDDAGPASDGDDPGVDAALDDSVGSGDDSDDASDPEDAGASTDEGASDDDVASDDDTSDEQDDDGASDDTSDGADDGRSDDEASGSADDDPAASADAGSDGPSAGKASSSLGGGCALHNGPGQTAARAGVLSLLLLLLAGARRSRAGLAKNDQRLGTAGHPRR